MIKNKIILFFTISPLLVVLAAILLVYRLPPQFSLGTGRSLVQNSADLAQINLVENYQKYAANIIGVFMAEGSGKDNLLPAIKETKNGLIALKVPTDFADVHLDMVLSLNLMEKGMELGSEKQYNLGLNKFKEILNVNPWLKPAK
ncbi:MAG: hypothetical protein PHD51_04740 [Patescibacteria group bacterium]|nr:hypothetical protein [Patescibacteria group bacterium]MDD5043927.1 hypothetical protein [Patescibacteria group bacterium]MDD5490760.1 hypothetical protein [Patescibacteria group bacterium]